jgi:hypothetical protein
VRRSAVRNYAYNGTSRCRFVLCMYRTVPHSTAHCAIGRSPQHKRSMRSLGTLMRYAPYRDWQYRWVGLYRYRCRFDRTDKLTVWKVAP